MHLRRLRSLAASRLAQPPGIRALLILLVIGSLLPAVVGTAALIELTYRRTAEAVESSTLQAARALSQAVDNPLEQALTLAQVLASSNSLARGDLAVFHREASAAMALPNIAYNAVLVDRAGVQLLNTAVPPGGPLPRVTDLEAVRRVFETGAPVVGNLVIGTVVKRPIIGLLVPVGGRHATERALLIGVLPPELARLLASQNLPRSWVVVVLDRAGQIVARSHAPERYVGRTASAAVLSGIARTGYGTVRATLVDGTDVIATYARSPTSGWSVVIGIPTAELDATLHASIRWLGVGAASFLALGLLLGRLLSVPVVRAARALVQAAQSLGEGRAVSGRAPPVREARSVYEAIESASQLLRERDLQLRAEVERTSQLNAELVAHRDNLEALVSERTRQLEAALHAAQAASRTKGAFLANMSHEIRTPMNAILGLAHLLGRELEEPRHRDRIVKVTTAGEHLLGLLNDILDLSRLEAGRMQLRPRRFLLAQMLDDVVTIVAGLAEPKGLRVAVERAEDPKWLQGDEPKLRQALLNYVGNAIKFTDRGSVAIAVDRVEDNGMRVLLRFAVSDTGIGVEAETLARLFEPFEQADSSATRKAGGAGLGLAMTRELATLMAGTAGASSVPGVGSTFWFTAWLERSAPDAGSTRPAAAARGHAAPPRVLVVSAAAVARELVLALLEEAGVATAVASDVADALRCLRADHFDAVVVDTAAPADGDVDVFELVRILRQAPATRVLPVICTASSGVDMQMAMEAGCSAVLPTPVEHDDFLTALRRWVPVAKAPGTS